MQKIALTLLFLYFFSYLQGETRKIAEGTLWETEYHIIDTCKPGPTILIIGGMHGNEPAGAVAAAQILNWPIVKGKLVVIPRANVLALNANTRLSPWRTGGSRKPESKFPSAKEGCKCMGCATDRNVGIGTLGIHCSTKT